MAGDLKSKAEAKRLAKECAETHDAIKEFQEEVKALEKKRGIDKLKADLPVKQQRILNFMQKEGMKKLDIGDMGYVNFIQATHEHVWYATKADIPENAPRGAKSLRAILGKDMFMRITKRVVDRKALSDAVEAGEIDEDEIAPAHVEKKRAPYISFERGQ
jgi:hypothetical protein